MGSVNIPYSSQLDAGSAFTVGCWVRYQGSANNANLEGIVTSDMYMLELNGTKVYADANFGSDGDGDFVSLGGADVSDDQWHYVAFTYDRTQMQFYFDGQAFGDPFVNYGAIGSMSASSFVAIGSEDGMTEYTQRVGHAYFNGLIDEVTVYNRALSPAEMQIVFNNYGSSDPTVTTPSTADSLTLLPPTPGNNYVDLTWSNIRAREFDVQHSLSPNGPFTTIASLVSPDAFHNPTNSYRHVGAQNGVTHWYQIVATLPAGGGTPTTMTSAPQSATPLATLAPLPPDGFQAQLVPNGGAGRILLSWNSDSGATGYQVFVNGQGGMMPLTGFDGISTSCFYDVPAGTAPGTTFIFELRATNATSVASDMVTATLNYQEPPSQASSPVDDSIVLKVAGWEPNNIEPSLPVTGPTNLAIAVEVNVPNVQQVSFYAINNDSQQPQLIGTAVNPPYQITWFNVPGGSFTINAVAVAGGAGGSLFQPASTYSASADVEVTIQPQLAAYQTSATDLQLPAPGLPITLSRSYSSRDTSDSGTHFAVGWSASWMQSTLSLSANPGSGWTGVSQSYLGSGQYYISDRGPHYATVTLPDGESYQFGAQLANSDDGSWDPTIEPMMYSSDFGIASISISFQPFTVNQGSLSDNGDPTLTLDTDVESDDWPGLEIGFEPLSNPQFTYQAANGTQYTFGQPCAGGLTWLLTQIVDQNGNTLTYSYDGTGRLQSITHSNGRIVSFSYGNDNLGNQIINVYDTSGQGGPPVIIYTLDGNNQLSTVQQLLVRSTSAPVYQTTTYVYGNGTSANEVNDQSRITDVYDTRGVRMMHNEYADASVYTGDISTQTDANQNTTAYSVDSYGNVTMTKTINNGPNANTSTTVQVQSDPSGAISGVTLPASGSSASSTLALQNTHNDQGLVIAQTDANNNTTTYNHDDQNRLVGQTDPLGNTTSTLLNANGQPTVSTDANGDSTTYAYDSYGNQTQCADPSGTYTDSTYSSVDNSADNGTQFAFGLQLTETNHAPSVPYAIVTINTYDDSDSIVGDLIQATQEFQDSNGNPVGTPTTTSYEYDPNGNRAAEIKSRTVSPGVVQYIRTESTYDALNRVVGTQVKTGSTASGPWSVFPNTQTITVYNSLGKQASTTDGYNRTITYNYDVTGNLIETVYPDGSVSRTAYDGNNRGYIVQDRAVPNVTGSGASQVSVTTAPATLSKYDASGRVISVQKLSSVTLTESQAVADTDYISLAGGQSQDKMVASNLGAALSTTYTFYDAIGNVQYSVDGRGTVTENDYDAANHRIAVKVYIGYTYSGTGTPAPGSSAFNETDYTYDPNGNQLTVTDALGHATTSVYDGNNRVIQVISPLSTAPSGTVTNFTIYDGNGQKISQTDEAGITTAYGYDFRGLLTSVTLNSGGTQPATTTYQYDEAGNETAQTDANNHTTSFQYDALGRRTCRTLPNNVSESFQYSSVPASSGSSVNVLQTTYTDFNGRQTVSTDDILDRVVTKALPAISHAGAGHTAVTDFPATTVSYSYDPEGHQVQAVQSGGVNRTVSYAYDVLGRLRVKNTPEGTLTYGYDTLGTVTSISARYTYTGWAANPPYAFESLTASAPDMTRAEWDYTYDPLSRLQTVNQNATGADAIYGYDAVGNLQSVGYRNNLVTTYTYNERNWLRLMQTVNGATTVAQFDYDDAAGGPVWSTAQRLSPVGQRQQVAELINGTARTVDYSYDAFRRLVNETVNTSSGQPAGTIRYDAADTAHLGYDPVGNRQSRQVAGNSQLSAVVGDYSGNTFNSCDLLNNGTSAAPNPQFDSNGNTVQYTSGANTASYIYDAENRLVQQIENGAAVTLAYDADGNRISKTVGGTTTLYLVDSLNPGGYAEVMEERSAAGSTTVSYEYGLGLVSQNTGGTLRYYGQDGLGSVRYLTDGSGNVTDTYAYDAFGILIASSGSTPNNYLYCGQQFDGDLGLYYLRARYYKPDSGRFWTMDTYEGNNEDPLSLHKYLYANANPVNMDDFSGNAGESDATATGRAVEKVIKADFRKNCRGIGVAGPAVLSILKKLGTVGPSRALNVLFPDLVDIKNKEIFEIKPFNARQELEGAAQLALYLAEFNALDPAGGWHLGDASDYKPPLIFPIAMPPNEIVVAPPVLGLITYTTLGQLVKSDVKMVARSNANDIKDSLGITTLIDILAF